ncbi:LUD domain-containing protein [Egicoccus sp. AB-alg6-2]|uniref:LUD domain-containing protein n=1 Tax=Egicoccus sp. AB-alg6-2 TaxID=3242692 RepID=UPI00359D5D3A
MRAFEERYEAALADPNVREGLTAFQRGWRTSRDTAIAHLEAQEDRSFDDLRAELAAVKDRVLADWDHLLDQFTRNAEAAGSQVVRVATPGEANERITSILRDAGATVVVKGKSMVSEEIGLNHHLEANGIVPVETDLGEWILQLAGETPSHLVMPAIHKRKEQVAELFERVLGRTFPPDDIERMVAAARTELRQRFLTSGAGLSGTNALIAEGGAMLTVENEGNNRLAVALPAVHLVTAGIEKLVPTYADAMKQVRLLARSATGQPITVYTNFITGPRPGQAQHIVLLDNGRSAMAEDPDVAAALRCIRCGACANVCPPYGVVGGHAFGHVYTGAIGLVNTAFHHGAEAAAGPQSLCVSCGACATVCPVDIPLPVQILEVRAEVTDAVPDAVPAGRVTRLAIAAFEHRWLVDFGLRLTGVLTSPLRRDGVTRLPRALLGNGRLDAWIGWRTPPAVPIRPARDRLVAGGLREPPPLASQPLRGRRVQLFLQCLADRLAPEVPVAAATLLRAAGAQVLVRREQHCCGLPAYDAGEQDVARSMLRQTLDVLEGADDVVTPASSCLAMLCHDAPRLLRDDAGHRQRADQLAGRVHDLVGYLTEGPGRLPAGSLDDGDRTPVTVHRFCQASNTLGREDVVERFLEEVAGVSVVPLPEAGTCCGFGGSTSVRNPRLAAGILDRKLACVDETQAHVLITDNPGCLLHLRGGLDASGRTVRAVHLAEYLAGRLPGAGVDRPPAGATISGHPVP